MAKPTPLSAAKIPLTAFNEVLGRYPACIQAISQDKGGMVASLKTLSPPGCGPLSDTLEIAKPGQKTLAELDEYRYDEAVKAFGPEKAGTKSMGVDEVKILVEWKLYVPFQILLPATHQTCLKL